MNISNLVRKKLESLELGKTFKFKNFNIEDKDLALGKALDREVQNGNLKRLQKGVYYKMKHK